MAEQQNQAVKPAIQQQEKEEIPPEALHLLLDLAEASEICGWLLKRYGRRGTWPGVTRGPLREARKVLYNLRDTCLAECDQLLSKYKISGPLSVVEEKTLLPQGSKVVTKPVKAEEPKEVLVNGTINGNVAPAAPGRISQGWETTKKFVGRPIVMIATGVLVAGVVIGGSIWYVLSGGSEEGGE